LLRDERRVFIFGFRRRSLSGLSGRTFVLEFQTRKRTEALQVLEEDLAPAVEIDEAGEDAATFGKAVPGHAVASPGAFERCLIAVEVASHAKRHGKTPPG
jgi:hypothetical protein